MRYVHFSEICKKCGYMQNIRQSRIRVKLTCLTAGAFMLINVAVCFLEVWCMYGELVLHVAKSLLLDSIPLVGNGTVSF